MAGKAKADNDAEDEEEDTELDDEETDDEDNDDTMPDDDGDGDEDEDDKKPSDKPKAKKSEDKPDAWKPPTQAEHAKMLRANKRANKQAKEQREKLKALEAEVAKQKKEGGGDTDDLEAKLEAAKAEAQESAAGTWKARTVKQAAKAALYAEGLSGSPDRLIKLLDLDDIDIDDEGEIDGLEEQIVELKEEFPDRFKAKDDDDDEDERPRKPKKPTTKVDGGDKGKKGVKEEKSTAELIAAGLMGGSRN